MKNSNYPYGSPITAAAVALAARLYSTPEAARRDFAPKISPANAPHARAVAAPIAVEIEDPNAEHWLGDEPEIFHSEDEDSSDEEENEEADIAIAEPTGQPLITDFFQPISRKRKRSNSEEESSDGATTSEDGSSGLKIDFSGESSEDESV